MHKLLKFWFYKKTQSNGIPVKLLKINFSKEKEKQLYQAIQMEQKISSIHQKNLKSECLHFADNMYQILLEHRIRLSFLLIESSQIQIYKYGDTRGGMEGEVKKSWIVGSFCVIGSVILVKQINCVTSGLSGLAHHSLSLTLNVCNNQ